MPVLNLQVIPVTQHDPSQDELFQRGVTDMTMTPLQPE